MIRQERGSVLLLVLFMIVIFMLLGMAVMSASLGGAKRSEIRESDVQSLHLAEKALNEAVAYLVAKFDTYHSFTPEKIAIILDEFRDEMKARMDDSGVLNIETDLSDLKKPVGRITGFSEGNDGDIENVNAYKINIYAEGVVNGITRKLTQTVTLDTYPDFLRYALGSEGDVYLNGAPQINGDIYSGKSLKIKNEADYIYNNPGTELYQNLKTQYPLLDGIAYVQGLSNVLYCQFAFCDTTVATNYTAMSISKAHDAYNSNTLLGVNPEEIIPKDQGKFVPIDINESFIDKVSESVAAGDSDSNINSTVTFDGLMTHMIQAYGPDSVPNLIKVITPPTLPIDENDPGMGDYRTAISVINDDLNDLTKTTIYQGDLNLDSINLKQLLYSEESKNYRKHFPLETNESTDPFKSNWLIVNGDLNINNPLGNTDPIQVRGNILVRGEIYITGKVDFDATIFSLEPQGPVDTLKDSTTTIEDATIRGLEGADGARKQLLLISKGKILINRVDAFQPTDTYNANDDKVLQAYFYTDDSATLFGVGSTIWIRGGFFAKKKLVVNAVLGNTNESTGNSIEVNPGTAVRELPRLVIDYNNNYFNDQKAGLPRVNHVNVVIGKKTFVK